MLSTGRSQLGSRPITTESLSREQTTSREPMLSRNTAIANQPDGRTPCRCQEATSKSQVCCVSLPA